MVINLKSQSELSGFYIVYEGSTNLERPGIYGISHLCEHLVCKSIEHLMDDFDRDGISWNAYTDTNQIVFYFTGLESRLSKYRKKILNSLSSFPVTKEQFELERKIVLSEYEDYFNDQAYAHSMNLNRKLFNDYDPIGLKTDLENLKFMDCLSYFELQFQHPSKIINVSKTYKMKDNEIEFSNIVISKNISYGLHDVAFEIGNDFKDKTSLLMLGPITNGNHAEIDFINLMMSMGLTSPLYNEVREKRGLVYYISCYQTRFHNQGVVTIGTLTANRNVKEVIDTVEKVLNKPSLFLNKNRFDLIRDFFNVKREKEEILRYNNVGEYLTPDGWSIYSILDTIKLKDLKDVYHEYYDFSKFYISNDKKEFPNV